MAIGTNKISSVTGVSISAWRLCRNKYVDYKLAVPTIPASLAGSANRCSLGADGEREYYEAFATGHFAGHSFLCL